MNTSPFPAPPPNNGLAPTLEEAKQQFTQRYLEMKAQGVKPSHDYQDLPWAEGTVARPCPVRRKDLCDQPAVQLRDGMPGAHIVLAWRYLSGTSSLSLKREGRNNVLPGSCDAALFGRSDAELIAIKREKPNLQLIWTSIDFVVGAIDIDRDFIPVHGISANVGGRLTPVLMPGPAGPG